MTDKTIPRIPNMSEFDILKRLNVNLLAIKARPKMYGINTCSEVQLFIFAFLAGAEYYSPNEFGHYLAKVTKNGNAAVDDLSLDKTIDYALFWINNITVGDLK